MTETAPIVGEDGVASATPPDHLRCSRNDGKGWQCKGSKFQLSRYCEKHHNRYVVNGKPKGTTRKKVVTMKRHQQEEIQEENVVLKHRLRKRRREVDYRALSSIDEEEDDEEKEKEEEEDYSDEDKDEDEEITRRKKSRNYRRISEMNQMDKQSISELIMSLKASFRRQDFENVEKILQVRADKMKMEKEEAEKQVVQFKEELGIFETMCGQVTSEVEDKKEEIFQVREKLGEMEIKNRDIEDELQRCNRINDELKEIVGDLEKELEIVKERERRSEEKFTKMSRELIERISELERKNRELEAMRRSTDGGSEAWKKRVNQLETGAFLESPSKVSCAVGGKDSESVKGGLEGEAGCAANHACLSSVKVKKEASEHGEELYVSAICRSLTRERVTEEAKKCGSSQTKTQSESSCAFNSAKLPNLKEAMNCGGRIFASPNSDSVCCSSSKESKGAQLAGEMKQDKNKETKFQSEAIPASNGANMSQIRIKEEALNCDERLCTSPVVDSIHHSARGNFSKEFSPPRQSLISMKQSEERNESESRKTKYRSEATCALNGAKSSQVKIGEEALNCNTRLNTSAGVDSTTRDETSRLKSFLVLQSEEKRSAAEQTASDQFKISETLCNQPRNSTTRDGISRLKSSLLMQYEQKISTAEQTATDQFKISETLCNQPRNSAAGNASDKDGKELRADCDGIYGLLSELRRLKADKLDLKRISLPSGV